MTSRGAVGGVAAAAVAFTFGLERVQGTRPAPGNPVEGPGPGALEEVAPSGSPVPGGEATLGAGVPPSAASFSDPPPGLAAGGSSSFSRAAAGTGERAGPDPPAEDRPEEQRERGGSVRQPRGQAAGSRPWSVLRPALLARVRDLPTLLLLLL